MSCIRMDGDTQSRAILSHDTVREYAEQMKAGDVFPPVTVWFDGEFYWLSDGFQRIAALQAIGSKYALAEIRQGSLSDAKWSSYSSNSTHGIRRTKDDIISAIAGAIQHPNSKFLSNTQIAKYLNIPEATFRRLRKGLPTPIAQGPQRCLVSRNGQCYEMNTALIGRNSRKPVEQRCKSSSLRELENRLSSLKIRATPPVQGLLNIFGNWAFGSVSDDDCISAFGRLHQRWTRPSL